MSTQIFCQFIVRAYFWTLNSLPCIYMSVFMQGSHWLDYSSMFQQGLVNPLFSLPWIVLVTLDVTADNIIIFL